MLGFLFDFLIFGFISFILIVVIQFKTGFLLNKSLSLFGYKFEVKGEKDKSITYSVLKE